MIYSNIAEYELGDSMLARQTILDLHKEIERLHYIIKEVREYMEKHIAIFKGGDMLVDMNINELLEILEKENI